MNKNITEIQEVVICMEISRNNKDEYNDKLQNVVYSYSDDDFGLKVKNDTDHEINPEVKNDEFLRINAFLEGVENERKRLATDLHDSLGQELNIISLFIETLRTMDRNKPDFERYLDKIKSYNQKSIQTLRDVSKNLIPTYIIANDLYYVIEQLVKNLNTTHGTSIKFLNSKTNLQINSKEKELTIFRIIQEFLTNSLKHSKAEKIIIHVTQNIRNKFIGFQLEDNGIGFDENNISHKNGLDNIIYRLTILNAPYEFNSVVSEGTSLKFKIYV